MASGKRHKTLAEIWFWFSQIASLIGLASILDDLKIWVSAVAWVIERTELLLPWMASALTILGEALHPVTALWRSVVHPVINFLLFWLPIDLPLLVKDVVAVSLFAVLGWMRSKTPWKEASAARERVMARFVERHGIARSKQFALQVLSEAILEYRTAKSDPRSREHRRVAYLQELLGNKCEAFIQDIRVDPDFLEAQRLIDRSWDLERHIRMFVLAAAAFVLILLLLDQVMLSG